jgi:hypothetical protein
MNHISPSSLWLFEHKLDQFYDKYIAGGQGEEANAAMQLGSAFDAVAKASVQSVLWRAPDDLYVDLPEDTVVEARVLWRSYVAHIAEGPGMIFVDPKCDVEYRGSIAGVPMLGYADMVYTDQAGGFNILDWKVGRLRDTCTPYWRDQLTVYGLLSGKPDVILHVHNVGYESDGSVGLRQFTFPLDPKHVAKLEARINRAWDAAHNPAHWVQFVERDQWRREYNGPLSEYFTQFGEA